MRSFLRSGLILPLVLCGCAEPSAAPGDDVPALVVMVVVDQLRADLLDRYAPALSGGFARLAREARQYTGASHRHASTSTAVGHATLSTGVAPRRHGLVGNDFRILTEDGRLPSVYSVEDTLSPIVGFPELEGRSPANLLRGGLADWMVAADSGTRIVSISRKDRGAIPLAGRVPGHVYWIHASAGQFVTSTYYRDHYPDWVGTFNRERMPIILGDSLWIRLTPDSLAELARRDSVTYEGDGVNVTFPHRRDREGTGTTPEARNEWAGDTPAPDRAVLELAREAMRELELGHRADGPDYLALSFSQADYIGHDYGPMSQEQLSNLVHLDLLLDELLTLLDEEVGPGRWVLGLSADHGVMTAPEWLAEEGASGWRLTAEQRREMSQVAAAAAEGATSRDEMQARVAAAVEALPWVERVHGPTEVAGEPTDTMAALFGLSHREDRFWGTLGRYGLYVQLIPGVLNRSEPRGTGHGSPYWHDRHVPFILYGGGIGPGRSEAPVYTYDLAPTLAAMSGIPVPADLDGRSVLSGGGGNP